MCTLMKCSLLLYSPPRALCEPVASPRPPLARSFPLALPLVAALPAAVSCHILHSPCHWTYHTHFPALSEVGTGLCNIVKTKTKRSLDRTSETISGIRSLCVLNLLIITFLFFDAIRGFGSVQLWRPSYESILFFQIRMLV
jgi:hypothetical protein